MGILKKINDGIDELLQETPSQGTKSVLDEIEAVRKTPEAVGFEQALDDEQKIQLDQVTKLHNAIITIEEKIRKIDEATNKKQNEVLIQKSMLQLREKSMEHDKKKKELAELTEFAERLKNEATINTGEPTNHTQPRKQMGEIVALRIFKDGVGDEVITKMSSVFQEWIAALGIEPQAIIDLTTKRLLAIETKRFAAVPGVVWELSPEECLFVSGKKDDLRTLTEGMCRI